MSAPPLAVPMPPTMRWKRSGTVLVIPASTSAWQISIITPRAVIWLNSATPLLNESAADGCHQLQRGIALRQCRRRSITPTATSFVQVDPPNAMRSTPPEMTK